MTVIVAALIIAVTAVGLLRVIFHLRAIRATLVATTGGVQAVAALTAPVPPRLTSVNASLKPVRDFCTSTTGWVIGYTIGIVVVLVVVALVVPILLLARAIGNEAPKINDALAEAVNNTAPLGALRTTIEHATIIIGGLQRGRARLGG
jgi:hypothetical protein